MSSHSGKNFLSLTTLRDVARLDLGCIVFAFTTFLSVLLVRVTLAFHVALFLFFLASCTVGSMYCSEQFWFFELSLSLACCSFSILFLGILHPWSMSAPSFSVCNKWIRSVLASGYENPFFYVDKSLSVFDSSVEILWNSSNFGVGSWMPRVNWCPSTLKWALITSRICVQFWSS